jgi:hypothetical protein
VASDLHILVVTLSKKTHCIFIIFIRVLLFEPFELFKKFAQMLISDCDCNGP